MTKRSWIRVLLASEYPVFRVGMSAMLRGTGIRVVGAVGSVTGLLAAIRAKPPDVLIMDLQIGGGNGVGVLPEIQSAHPRMPIVVVASRESSVHLSRAISLSCAGVITQQVTAQELATTIRTVVRGGRIVDPDLLAELLAQVATPLAAEMAVPMGALSVPELALLRLIAEGKTNRQIAQALGYSLGTVKNYVQRIMLKLSAGDRTQAAAEAVKRGLIGGPEEPPHG